MKKPKGKRNRTAQSRSVQRLVRTPAGTIESRPVVGWEAAALWMNAALSHMEKAMEWARSNRRNRMSKIKYYMGLSNEAMVDAKREMRSPNDPDQLRLSGTKPSDQNEH